MSHTSLLKFRASWPKFVSAHADYICREGSGHATPSHSQHYEEKQGSIWRRPTDLIQTYEVGSAGRYWEAVRRYPCDLEDVSCRARSAYMLSENEGTRPAILELIRNLKSSAFLPGNVVVMIGVTEPESSHEQGECPKVKQRVSRIPLAVVPHKYVPCRFYDLTFNGGFIVIYVKDKTAQRRARSNMVQRRGKLRRRYIESKDRHARAAYRLLTSIIKLSTVHLAGDSLDENIH
ncbi:hypothetical protein V8E53_001010 [Lactarius tabidus]